MTVRRRGIPGAGGLAVLAVLALGACGEEAEVPTHLRVVGGDPAVGEAAIRARGCGACHTIPGIRDARGIVGPPLIEFGRRSYLAGVVPNTPGALTWFLQDPPAFVPNIAMPDMSIREEEARHIAAFLYTLR